MEEDSEEVGKGDVSMKVTVMQGKSPQLLQSSGLYLIAKGPEGGPWFKGTATSS